MPETLLRLKTASGITVYPTLKEEFSMAEETNTTVTETNQAENSGGDPQGNAGNADAVSTNEGAEKTFTQKELDEIVKQRLERERKGMPTKDEMKAFKAWQDSQKTAEQLSAEKVTAAENGKAEAEKRAEAAEAKCVAFSKGVSAEAVDDVIALASPKVGDNKTMEQAIDEVLAKYPSFTKAAPPKITTGASMNGSVPQEQDGVTAAFLKKNPEIKI
ncbi:MAG: hypothetical protein MRZ39_08445 [Oscillospiraceae bacterium]|nr:hypothetical protein [Oscillospiraceae bacterium]